MLAIRQFLEHVGQRIKQSKVGFDSIVIGIEYARDRHASLPPHLPWESDRFFALLREPFWIKPTIDSDDQMPDAAPQADELETAVDWDRLPTMDVASTFDSESTNFWIAVWASG